MNAGGCPSWHCPPPRPTWHFSASGPFPRVARGHYTIPVPWTLGLLWPISPVPGVPSTRYSPFNSHAPSRSMDSCTPPNGFRAFFPHQQQNDLLLVNLANPLTNIKLTPESLGWDSLLPPLSYAHHAFHIHSIHTLGPLSHTHSTCFFQFFHSLHTTPMFH